MRTHWGYEVWYDGCCITEDLGYETESDAEEMAEEAIASYLEEWPDTERSDYEIRTEEYDVIC